MTHQTTHQTASRTSPSKIAIIGSGVSGLTCAHYLVKEHDVTIFEANEYLGGHVNTIDVEIAEPVGRFKKTKQIEKSSIDTGFIVFNERTYPNFFRLLDELNVPFQKTDMSFSVKNPAINFEYNGHTLNSLVSQRKNILNPKFWRFVKDILRFNSHIKRLREEYQQLELSIHSLNSKIAQTQSKRKNKKLDKQLSHTQMQLSTLSSETLGDYLATQSYGQLFTDNYLLPMVSAIWSMGLEDSQAFPLIFFAQFFDNHGLLDVVNRPQWFTIKGGSKQYVNKLVKRYADMGGKALVNAPVQSVSRACTDNPASQTVSIQYKLDGQLFTDNFDEVIFACHADVAKRLLTDISEEEQQVLGAFNFTDNEAILHTDTTALPKRPLAWASWNYLLPDYLLPDKGKKANNQRSNDYKPVLTYHMNILQRLVKKHNYLVTLNEPIHDHQVIKRIDYRHPVYDVNMTHAQKRWADISGAKPRNQPDNQSGNQSANTHTHFAGAYWFNGFHEDGVRSGVRVCESLGIDIKTIDIVNPAHLDNIIEPNPRFSYNCIPVKADKKQTKLSKRQVISAKTNTDLNHLFGN